MTDQSLERAANRYAEKLGKHNVIAVFPTLEEARQAMQALQLRGIDAANISLLGRAAEEAAVDEETTPRDGKIVEDVAKKTAGGAVAGGAVGGIAGVLAGLAAFAIPGIGPAVGTGLWLAGLGGATLGGGIGGMVAGVSAINAGQAWELTYHVKEGRALVGVHADDPEVVDQALKVLEEHKPLEMGRFDENGRRIEP